jgi:hypothetical protein
MIEIILIMAAFVNGLKISTYDGMIFEKPAKLIPNLIRKPLVDCIYCMGGFYTLIVSLILGYGLHSLLMAGSCIFVAGLFYEILYKLEK